MILFVVIFPVLVFLISLDQPVFAGINADKTTTSNQLTDDIAPERVSEMQDVTFEIVSGSTIYSVSPGSTGEDKPTTFGVRIGNNTNHSYRFCSYDTLYPVLFDEKNRPLELKGGRDRSRQMKETDCKLLNPGESATFAIEATIGHRDGRFFLKLYDGFGGLWLFDELPPGKYGLQFKYSNNQPTVMRIDTKHTILNSLWIVEMITDT